MSRPEDFYAPLRLTYDWAKALSEDAAWRAGLAPALAALDVPEPHLTLALRRTLAALLEDDARAVHRARSAGAPPVRTPNAPLLARVGVPAAEAVPAAAPLAQRARAAAYWPWLALQAARPEAPRRPAPRAAWLFDQYYGTMDDQEFLAFDRVFAARTDVAYVLPPGRSEKRAWLEARGRPFVAHRWGVPGPRKAAELAALARLAAAVARAPDLPAGLALGLARLMRARLRWRSLLEDHPAARALRVRHDMDPTHPVAAAEAERAGTRLVGYMCGSYSYFTYVYAPLDFHEYGLLGRRFPEVFGEAWSSVGRFAAVGPFTAEAVPLAPKPDARAVALFPTSYDAGFLMDEAFYRSYLSACAGALAGRGRRVLVKEKDRSHAGNAAALAERLAGLDYAVVYNEDRRSPEVMAEAELCLVMGGSTAAWEALGLGRKVLVYEVPGVTHPFEGPAPALVAKSPEELKAKAAALLAMSAEEYRRVRAPVLADWCAPADGRLTANFIDSLEHG